MKIKMPITKTYSLSEHKQLVDLNGDSTNFDLTFTATSKDKSTFNVLVVNQTTLDNTQDFEYKVAKGEISGNIISDKNVYQNYFLVLKADKPVDVVVTIDKQEIQPAQQEQHPASIQPSIVPQQQPQPGIHHQPHTPIPSTVNWKLVGIVSALVIGGILLYFYYNRELTDSDASTSSSSDTSSTPPSTHTTPVSTHTSTPSSTPGKGSYFDTKGVNNDLLNRINRFPIR